MVSALYGAEKGTGPVQVIMLETLMEVSGHLSTSTTDVLLRTRPALGGLEGDRSSQQDP